MSLYGKTVCTIYEAKNGYMLEFQEPAEKGKNGMTEPGETEHVLAKSVPEVLKLIKQELSDGGKDDENTEYAEGFKDAVAETKK